MNVIIENVRKEELSNLDIDIIKTMSGEFDPIEIVSLFKNFYYNKMIIDVTAIKDYANVSNLIKLTNGLDPNKLILFLPKEQSVSSQIYLAELVKGGLYNFTNNIEGVKYLINHTNTHEEVAYIEQVKELSEVVKDKVSNGCRIIGIRNITDHAGATTLIYMLKRELERIYGENVYAIEVSRHDLQYFNVKNTISTTKDTLVATINKLSDAAVILVDLNDYNNEDVCGDVLYLIEPSSIRLNKLMRTNKNIFNELNGKKIILNKSLLNEKDVNDFEDEAKTKIIYNVPPLDERRKNDKIVNLIDTIGLNNIGTSSDEEKDGRIFGLFRF